MGKVKKEFITALIGSANQLEKIQVKSGTSSSLETGLLEVGTLLRVQAASLESGQPLKEADADWAVNLIKLVRTAASDMTDGANRALAGEAFRLVDEVIDRHAQLVGGLSLFRKEDTDN
jgi:hypothetical protein